ncbi:MAG: VCBS repeat-containing protein [Flavobacteriaceae bacterium]|nr:VCBS repeat-containing protein [Flavobacteriaceae bacterium]
MFELLDNQSTGINIINEIETTRDLHVFRYRNFYNGGGVSIGDVNNDGLADVYLTINRGPNKLYLNKGDFKFEDITESAGVAGTKQWSTGVVMVDINSDGFLDIYVCNAGIVSGDEQDNELFINNGDGTFTEEAESYNLADSGITTHAAFFDYDLDGDLDVYILNNSFIPITSLNYNDKRGLRDINWDVPSYLKGGGDKLLRNDNNFFTDVSEESGIYGSLIGFGLGVTLGDVDKDGYVDIYVSNDFYERDYLYMNQGDGTFNEEVQEMVSHLSHSSMGADMADLNNDGYVEIYVTDMLPEGDQRLKETTLFESFDTYRLKLGKEFYHQFMQNTLQFNNEGNSFSEISCFAGVEATDWSWGALLFDMDNDGYKDIFVCNGIYHELTNQDFMNFFANDVIQKMVLTGKKEEVENIVKQMPSRPIPNYAFQNNKNLKFTNQTTNWGFEKPTFSNGAAYGDLDNDGDLDLVINNVNEPIMVYKNKSSERGGNYVKIRLEGDEENINAIGAKVSVYYSNKHIYNELIPTKGFQSSVEYTLTVGLGDAEIVDSIEVVWPDQSRTLTYSPSINSLQFIQKENSITDQNPKEKRKTLFTTQNLPAKKHNEDNFVDYNYEQLVSKMISREGPAIAIADVDKNGLDDIYIGGSRGDISQLILQNKPGVFVNTEQSFLITTNPYEDTTAIFIDIDSDGDQDLVVGSGGNNPTLPNSLIQDRVYLNDGNGTFSYDSMALPNYISNTSVIAPHDFNGDGAIDLFIGNRSISGLYGVNPNSVLLQNNGNGVFENVTDLKAYDFNELGMITDAEWIDLSGDNQKELIIVGSWMSPVVYSFNGVYFEKKATALDKLNGWWDEILNGDFNNDGTIDIVLGNKGLNSVYTGTEEAPARMYINDFDDNGTLEQIHTRDFDGIDKPIHIKSELISQLTFLKKTNLKFSEYAKKDIYGLFSKEKVNESIIKEVNESRSVVALNSGNFDFSITPLPNEVQWNSVNTGIVDDFNNDGNLDLILAGGEDNLKPQFSKLDSGFASLLLGNGDGKFSFVPVKKSGLPLKGTVRSSVKINMKNHIGYLLGINNQNPIFYVLQ